MVQAFAALSKKVLNKSEPTGSMSSMMPPPGNWNCAQRKPWAASVAPIR